MNDKEIRDEIQIASKVSHAMTDIASVGFAITNNQRLIIEILLDIRHYVGG